MQNSTVLYNSISIRMSMMPFSPSSYTTDPRYTLPHTGSSAFDTDLYNTALYNTVLYEQYSAKHNLGLEDRHPGLTQLTHGGSQACPAP